MSHDELNIDIKVENDGDMVIYRLRGSLDIATSPELRAALTESSDDGKHQIIVDLTALDFLDSTGLGALIGAHRRATEHGGVVRLVVGDGRIMRLLNITGLIHIFPVYSTLEDARNGHARIGASV